MTVDSAIARFRRRQQDVFRDEATVSRPVSTGTISTTSGDWTPGAASTVYSGPCLLRALAWEGTDVAPGDVEVRLRRVTAKFPVDTAIQRNDIIVPSVSTYDASLVGKSFRVTDPFRDGWQIVRRVIAEEIV